MLAVHRHQQDLVEYNYKRRLQRENWLKESNAPLPDQKTIALNAALRTAGKIVKNRTNGKNSGNFLLEFCIKALDDFRYAKEVFERLHPIEKNKEITAGTDTKVIIEMVNEISQPTKIIEEADIREISID